MQETWVQSLGQEGPLEKEIATHSSILAWEIPWTGSLEGCSPWGCTESSEKRFLHPSGVCSWSGLPESNRRHHCGQPAFAVTSAVP